MGGRNSRSKDVRRSSAAVATKDLSPQEAVTLLREQAQRWLRLPNVTSVGVGKELRRGELTGNLSIQVTVREKLWNGRSRAWASRRCPTS